ncbi:acyl-CoA dehydrogenase family protein [Actinomadura madurae]|uniref:acyl-CoA dehydrogenase family protein n=1 Tax=Actinomadura madurae TaxID=1993 RepID=UPI003FD7773D
MSTAPPDADELSRRVGEFLAAHDPSATEPLEFLRARFDAGLAWVHYPEGLGGLGAPRHLQPAVDRRFAEAGAPPTTRSATASGSAWRPRRSWRSAPRSRSAASCARCGPARSCGASCSASPAPGSDLAALATRAVRDGDAWTVDGQKVWTSMAHEARWAILVTRTDPGVPKHRGMTYFVCDMTAPGVEVRPLRQITGEAEFNEVFLTGVRIPDEHRLGEVGEGWRVATTTLMNERVAIGGSAAPRESGMIGVVAGLWRDRPELRTPALHDALLRAWVETEAARLTGARLRQQLAAGHPGPEGSGAKLAFARLNQEVSGLELELLGEDGLRYDDWTMRRPTEVDFTRRSPGYRYLRAKGNSIEGGTSEILRNIIAERVLGLPGEIRVDKDVAWKDLPK